ncbi:MAG: DHH family phosphoesterase [Bacteroidales bacterium]|nr:DHH family phosphoesterase [Bacteroidales bacterium]
MNLDKKNIQKLEALIADANKITLCTHQSPDADTIGSALALSNVLLQMGKQVKVVCPNTPPDFLDWMVGIDSILVHDKEGKEVYNAVVEADLLFAMDFNAPHRTANVEKAMLDSSAKKVLIDHHLFPEENYFDLMFSFPKKSSTCELLFEILDNSNFKKYLNVDIATNIFVGIMTDTGSFAYSCNEPSTFEIVAKLIRLGVNVKETHDIIFNNNTIERLRVLGLGINDKLKVFPDKKAAYISFSKEELSQFGDSEGLTEGIVNYGLSIKGICFAALLTEKGDKIKISFRSKKEFNVNAFARENFEGGGHFNAAGGKSFLSLKDTEKKLENLISNFKI